ncbi:MAG: hypothetical protein ACFFE2_08810 [Candidatus Thorarchaeota archaeon]
MHSRKMTETHNCDYRGLAPTGKTHAMAPVSTHCLVDSGNIIAQPFYGFVLSVEHPRYDVLLIILIVSVHF